MTIRSGGITIKPMISALEIADLVLLRKWLFVGVTALVFLLASINAQAQERSAKGLQILYDFREQKKETW